MQNIDLFKQFKELVVENSDKKVFSVISVPNTDHKLGISKEGYPKFFICTNDTVSSTPNTTLDILSVEYNLSCTFVDEDGGKITHHYTVITLRSIDLTLQEDFIDIVLMMLARLTAIPSKREIAIEVENLISIFSAMTCPPRKKIQGLWAELLVIEQSYMPEVLINAWHENPSAKYDFTMGRDKLEVKSTSSETRVHHFSLDQLCPSTHSRVVIASTIVRESAQGNGGLSVRDLYDRICKRVDSVDARIHITKVIAETIGTDMHRLNEVFFDYIEACDTLKFYDSSEVPGVDKSGVHPGVTGVGFNSNLSGAIDIQAPDSTFQRTASPLYKSLYK